MSKQIYIRLRKGRVRKTMEIDDVMVDFNREGKVIGVEILPPHKVIITAGSDTSDKSIKITL